MIERGQIHWIDLGPAGEGDHRPAGRRPVVVIQADAISRSRLATVIVMAITSNLEAAARPGCVLLPARQTGLPRDSVATANQVGTVNRYDLPGPPAGQVPAILMAQVDQALALMLGLTLQR